MDEEVILGALDISRFASAWLSGGYDFRPSVGR
jgi:hypothetical protein